MPAKVKSKKNDGKIKSESGKIKSDSGKIKSESETNKSTKSVTGDTGKSKTTSELSLFNDSEDVPARWISLDLELLGDPPTKDDYTLIAIFNQVIILEEKWKHGAEIKRDPLPINLNEDRFQVSVSSNPIIFILRVLGGKAGKQETDILVNADNRAGGTVDLLPLLLGEEEIFTSVHLVSLITGKFIGCEVTVHATAPEWTEHGRTPLVLTMISAHCMPVARDGTVYISALGLSDMQNTPKVVDFGQSLSTSNAQKIVWAKVSSAGLGANTALNVPDDDIFISGVSDLNNTEECRSFYWNAMNRVLVDPKELSNRLSAPFLIEVAGVPKTGKMEVRGRYMGWVDARALLEPGQLNVTVCVPLLYYSETQIQHVGGGILELPPTSAKTVSARETDVVLDEFKHTAYIVIRFDLTEFLVNKTKLIYLYETLGYSLPGGPIVPIDQLDADIVPEEPVIDARYIRKEAGALAVHTELSNLACQGGVLMNQGIKRSAANRLLMRVRTMLKSFPPGDCTCIDWQDTVTGQHAASRRAVTASFAPQPPRPHVPDRETVARCKAADDTRLAERYVKTYLKIAGSHPRSLLCKTLRCLEERNDLDARNYLIEALNNQPKNKYLIWILGAQEFDQGAEGAKIAAAAFRLAVKGDNSDGTTNAIAWAAVHALHHFNGNIYGSHVAVKKMRKAYSLPVEWQKVLQRYSDITGEKEALWSPSAITTENPILIAAGFFLCLRCYKFSEILLLCVEKKCATRGSSRLKYIISEDVYYLRAVSCILRRQVDRAIEFTEDGIQTFGPSSLMSQMRLTCISVTRNWNTACEMTFEEAERAGSKPCSAIYYKAALNGLKLNPQISLQRAALAHKIAPSGHTALLIGRIYARLENYEIAERWCACAVKVEPLLSDGWAMLCILAMYDRNIDKARTMLRTARQVGPIASDIEADLKDLMEIVKIEQLPDSLVKNLCLKVKYQ